MRKKRFMSWKRPTARSSKSEDFVLVRGKRPVPWWLPCCGISAGRFAAIPLPQRVSVHRRAGKRDGKCATPAGGIFRRFVEPGQEVEYGQKMGVILDPFTAEVEAEIACPTSGVVFLRFEKTADNRTWGRI